MLHWHLPLISYKYLINNLICTSRDITFQISIQETRLLIFAALELLNVSYLIYLSTFQPQETILTVVLKYAACFLDVNDDKTCYLGTYKHFLMLEIAVCSHSIYFYFLYCCEFHTHYNTINLQLNMYVNV